MGFGTVVSKILFSPLSLSNSLCLCLMSLQFGFNSFLITLLLLVPSDSNYQSSFTAQESLIKAANRLSSPLINDDGRVYICLEKNLLAFESNGTIVWKLPLGYTCDVSIAPVHGGVRTLYLVAENRVLKVNFLKIGTSESAVEVFFDPEPGEIIGLSVSTSSSCVLVNVKNRALFAFRLHGRPLWSAGPVIYQHGYRQGCRKNTSDCYFTSIPVIDQCEASIYVSNNEGELYSLSVRSPHFKWIQDLSSLDKRFTVTPGNNGLLYVTVPTRALMLALDVSRGTILWQKTIGPLSTIDYAPVVDSNGWVSIGSVDGFLYSLSPTGDIKKFPKAAAAADLVVQVSPALDCSGYAVYISQTEMEGKYSRTIGEYTYISAMKPRNVIFTMLVPATGSIYWSESYPGPFSSLLSKSDLQHFVLDERILLAFVSASSIGSPLPCRSTRQKLASICSHTMPKRVSIYTGSERAILLFLFLESVILIILAALVRFCCIFWRKKKLQDQGLGKFLEKRHSLRLQKKTFDRTISELEQKAAQETLGNEVVENMGDIVRERESIERKLSTTYSLGRDRPGSQPKSLLPLYDGKAKSFSFQGAKKGTVTVFHTTSDTSSEDSSSNEEEADESFNKDSAFKGKGKAAIEVGSCSDDGSCETEYQSSTSESASGSKGLFINPLFMDPVTSEPEITKISDDGEAMEIGQNSGSRSIRRRRTSSSTN